MEDKILILLGQLLFPPDASECGDPSSERAWCGARGECVEGEGGSLCACAKGFTSSSLHTAECVRQYYRNLSATWNISIVIELIST